MGLAKLLASGATVKIIQIALGFVTSIVLTRTVSVETFGTYSYNVALITLLSLVFHLGIPGMTLAHLPRGKGKHTSFMTRQALGWGYVGATSCAIAYLTLQVVTLPQDPLSAALWAVVAALTTFTVILVAIGRASGAVLFSSIMELDARQILFLAALPLILVMPPPLALPVASIMAYVATCAVLIVRIVPLRTMMHPGRLSMAYIARSWLFALVSVGWAMNQYLDVLLVGILADAEAVAIYRLATLVSSAAGLGIAALDMVLAPRVAQMFAAGKKSQLTSMCQRSALLSGALTTGGGIVFWLVGGDLLAAVFGNTYADAFAPAAILVLMQVIVSLCGPAALCLMLLGRERLYVGLMASFTAVNLALNLTLVPRFGAEGAAIATLVAVAAMNIVSCVLVRNLLGVRTWGWLSNPLNPGAE